MEGNAWLPLEEVGSPSQRISLLQIRLQYASFKAPICSFMVKIIQADSSDHRQHSGPSENYGSEIDKQLNHQSVMAIFLK